MLFAPVGVANLRALLDSCSGQEGQVLVNAVTGEVKQAISGPSERGRQTLVLTRRNQR
jgi:hypothetical protein